MNSRAALKMNNKSAFSELQDSYHSVKRYNHRMSKLLSQITMQFAYEGIYHRLLQADLLFPEKLFADGKCK